MHKSRSKYRRPLVAVGAVALAATLVLGGTMAWQSISQEVKNENARPVNAGGRLHDDYNGTNKDVYAENFGETELIVRVRLDEFMELGLDAGKENPEQNTKRDPVDAGTSFDKPEGWKTHTLEGNLGSHAYLQFRLGGQTVYLPTFNMNKDSLDADINGTFKGGGSGKHFSDYKIYQVGTGVSGKETLDGGTTASSNTTHYPQLTANATVISMAQWKAKPENERMGPFWVYDTDGWAYWAEPLMPATATGLLLDEVKMTSVPDRDWYWAINVVAQFATLNDIGEAGTDGGTGTGFYDTTKGKAPSADAQELLKMLRSHIDHRAALSSDLSTQIRNANGTTTTVTIDGTEFYVLNVAGNRAVLLTKNAIKSSTFGPSNAWKDSIARVECRRWLEGKPTLAKSVIPQIIRTRNPLDNKKFYVTGDSAFLLSEADVLGSFENNAGKVLIDDYTFGKKLFTDENKGILTGMNWWLRSPFSGSSYVLFSAGGSFNYNSPNVGYDLRPSVVVKLADPAAP